MLADGKLDVVQTCQMALRVAVGLKELHKESFAHLDLKPDNILLDDACNAVLSDFSVSHHFQDKGATVYKPSLANTAIGTRFYM